VIAPKLAGAAASLAALFGVGALAGGVLHPSAPGGDAAAGMGHDGEKMAMEVRGLAVADNGLRLVVANSELRRGREQQLRFRIVDDSGNTVRDFDIEHTKRMHLIVARRDLTGFQHLHPTMAADGTWSVPLRLADAGSYRVFADFSHDNQAVTLADDLRVDGMADLHPLPLPATTATTDGGYDVRLDEGAARAGADSQLRFTVTKDGRPVRTEPYLGAGGHLVALRDGDLAFLHVHPTESDGAIGFDATFPTVGDYRLFLQFKVGGAVQTVAFTQEVR
jgi:hypothetical protein